MSQELEKDMPVRSAHLVFGIPLEKFNVVIGFMLLMMGGFEWFHEQWLMMYSWLIFGCMYLVMGDYESVGPTDERRFLINLRKIFSVLGVVFCLMALYYYASHLHD